MSSMDFDYNNGINNKKKTFKVGSLNENISTNINLLKKTESNTIANKNNNNVILKSSTPTTTTTKNDVTNINDNNNNDKSMTYEDIDDDVDELLYEDTEHFNDDYYEEYD